MPNVVMMAKSSLVWLDQLSKSYGSEIRTLDAIPDEELDALASRRGFNALWLIGIWERSGASAEIKRRCGNPEAAPSAYSLFDYEIAGELGGWPGPREPQVEVAPGAASASRPTWCRTTPASTRAGCASARSSS